MPSKKKVGFHIPAFFSKYEQYLKWTGLGIVAILGIMRFYYLPERVSAAEKEIIDIKEYTQASREEKKALEDAIKNAPEGWKWDLVEKKYVVYKDDPRLKKK